VENTVHGESPLGQPDNKKNIERVTTPKTGDSGAELTSARGPGPRAAT